MKKILKTMVAAVMVGLLAGPQFTPSMFAAASGNYTDLLPVGAAANTTVISNGSGWSLTTLPPTATFGDALSRVVTANYQLTTSTSINTTTAASTMTALAGAVAVGTTTFPIGWIAVGRTIRYTARGKYGTTSSPTWNWGISLGTTSVIATGAVAAPTTVSNLPWSESCMLTIQTVGAAGAVNVSCDIFVTTSVVVAANGIGNVISYSTTTQGVAVDLSQTSTAQNIINPLFTWGSSSASNALVINNATIEFMN